MPDSGTIPFRKADPNGHYRSKQLPNDNAEFLTALGLPAFAGDVVGPAGSTANQVATFADGTGKRLQAAADTGLAKLASGVLSSVPAPAGAVVGTTDVQTLTNKTLVSPVITGTGMEMTANKGVANGYASLDASVKVPMSQIPDALVGASQYQGTWNAATNTPAIPAAAIGNKGWYYSVSVAGSTNINGISSWAVGDDIISNGTVWQKIPNVSAVNSVNGQTGVVVLTKTDVGLGNVDNTSDATKNSASATLTNKTLTSPVINSPTGITKTDVGLANVDNTSDATKNSATATLTGKTINGANNTLTVRLANDVTGNLPVGNLNSGTGANSGSFWRGDGQWAPPAGGGDVVGPAGGVVDGELVAYNLTTGKIIKGSGGKLAASLVTGPASAVSGNLATFSGTTGKIIQDGGPVGASIWSVRLRSYNAVGNPNFEVDQRNVGAAVVNSGNGYWAQDRWSVVKAGTMVFNTQQMAVDVPVPGTSFNVTSKILRTTLTTAQGSLGASDYMGFNQAVEGCQARELLGDVHSVSLLVRSSVVNLKFSVVISDSTGVWSINKLCSMGAANTWTLITLPNMPVFAAGATWSRLPGVTGYNLGVCLAAGSGKVTASPDVWLNTSKAGVSGMSNFAGSATSSTFDMAVVQHEPGLECSTLTDCPWTQNYDGCLRYFQKSWNYDIAVGTGGPLYDGGVMMFVPAGGHPMTIVRFVGTMMKSPTVTGYSTLNGAINAVHTITSATNWAITQSMFPGTGGFSGFTTNVSPGATNQAAFHWVADTNS